MRITITDNIDGADKKLLTWDQVSFLGSSDSVKKLTIVVSAGDVAKIFVETFDGDYEGETKTKTEEYWLLDSLDDISLQVRKATPCDGV